MGIQEKYCFADVSVESELVEECAYDCVSGECVDEPICDQDSDCGLPGWFNGDFCADEDVWGYWEHQTCVNPGQPSASCVQNMNWLTYSKHLHNVQYPHYTVISY